VAPGLFSHPAPFLYLNISERGRPLLADSLARLDKIGFTCRFVADEPTLMWKKLVILAPVALATSADGWTIGQVLDNRQTRQRLESCTREACTVATAENATVSVEQSLEAAQALPASMRSSMQKDVEKGNPSELDAIAGPILRGGQRHRIPVPATEELAEAVRRRAAKPRG
jgi:2-dehydropantoate 2-reductase